MHESSLSAKLEKERKNSWSWGDVINSHKTIKKHPDLHPLNCFAYPQSKDFQRTFSSKVYIPNHLLQLFVQSKYLKIVSYINLIFHNILTMVQNFQTLFKNFALVIMSKLVTSKPNISKTYFSYLLKYHLMCTFQEAKTFIFKVEKLRF